MVCDLVAKRDVSMAKRDVALAVHNTCVYKAKRDEFLLLDLHLWLGVLEAFAIRATVGGFP